MTKKVYILHGWTYETEEWNVFLDKLKEKDISPVMLKIPGLTEKIDRPWNLNDYVSWLNEKLLNENKVVLIGHSNGGKIALSYSLKYPSKVSKLFLIDSAGIYHNELPLKVKRIIFKFLAKLGKKVTKSESLKNLLYRFAKENDYNIAPEIMKITMQNLINDDLTKDLENIKAETNIIWGSDDKITLLSDGKLMNKCIKNSKLIIIKGARHSPQFTHTDEVINYIYENL